MIGIYEAHQAFSGVGGRLWFLKVTPDVLEGVGGVGGAHQAGVDAGEQDSQTTCLRSAGLLNHHHSSHLHDRLWRYITCSSRSVGSDGCRRPQTVTTSLAAGHRHLMLRLPVIKPSPQPRSCVKHHLNCQLGGCGRGVWEGRLFPPPSPAVALRPACCLSDVAG